MMTGVNSHLWVMALSTGEDQRQLFRVLECSVYFWVVDTGAYTCKNSFVPLALYTFVMPLFKKGKASDKTMCVIYAVFV